jgi:PhzF family phenazine biosynthesis protein
VTVAIHQVDTFTATPFAGNPAAVCLLSSAPETAWMSAVARETNMPATAFVYETGDGYALRWFTATAELELCGHGTLASAHVLFETGRVPQADPIRFHSCGGVLTAVRRGDWIELDFPSAADQEISPPAGLVEALGVDVRYVGGGRLDCIVELEDEAAVRGVKPDLARLREIPTRGIIVTSRASSPEWDFVSRFFAPSVGIVEDAVTGSAHCCLAPFWAKRLNKTTLTARQLSARGGVLKVAVDGDRVRIGGQAVTVFRGQLC